MWYHEEYDAKKDVPIVSAATAWTHPDTGETFILDYHHALWYGKEVANSLLNPNQMRFYGHRVSDDITDKNRRFGIEADNMLYIPFDMKGTVISFDSRVPTDQELQDCDGILQPCLWQRCVDYGRARRTFIGRSAHLQFVLMIEYWIHSNTIC